MNVENFLKTANAMMRMMPVNNSLSNIWLHGSVTNPETLADIMLATGLIAVPSNRTKGIVMITEEAYLIRQALQEVDKD